MKRTAPINAPNVLQGSLTTKSKRFVRVVQSGFSKVNRVNLHVKIVRGAKRTTSHVQRVVRFVFLVTQVEIALHALPGSILLIHPPAGFVHPVGSNRTTRPLVARSVRWGGTKQTKGPLIAMIVHQITVKHLAAIQITTHVQTVLRANIENQARRRVSIVSWGGTRGMGVKNVR